MLSNLAKAIALTNNPVALLWSDAAPAARDTKFKSGKWGCVASLFGSVAKTGRTAVIDRATYGCWGGGVEGWDLETVTRHSPAAFLASADFWPMATAKPKPAARLARGWHKRGRKNLPTTS